MFVPAGEAEPSPDVAKVMPLTLRPTGSSPVDQNRQDFTVYSGDWPMGRIYEQRGAPEHIRWFWSIFGILAGPPGVHTTGHAATVESAKLDFETSWHEWLKWAELAEAGRNRRE